MDHAFEPIDTLTELVADPAADVSVLLASVLAAAGESIDSLTSATLIVTVENRPFTVSASVPTPRPECRTSIAISLRAHTGSGSHSELVLRASTPGAFVDLAAAVRAVMRLEPGTIATDAHLTTAEAETGYDHGRHVDQAVGVLVARGASVDHANAYLRRRSEHEGLTLGATALSILEEATVQK